MRVFKCEIEYYIFIFYDLSLSVLLSALLSVLSHFSQELQIRDPEIWLQALCKNAIQCDAFSNSSLINFLYTKRLHILTYINGHVWNVYHIFLSNYKTGLSEIWNQPSCEHPLPCDTFSHPLLINFLYLLNTYKRGIISD